MRKAIIALTLAAASVAPSFAHPHVFIDVSLRFDFDGDRCLGFWQEWSFDPVLSAQIRNAFMLPASGPLSRYLQDELYNGAFINLRRYGFYTLLRRGERRESPKAVTQFGAELSGNRVVYRFFVPLDASYAGGFSVAVFDATYYSAVRYLGEPAFTQRREGAAAPPALSAKAVPVPLVALQLRFQESWPRPSAGRAMAMRPACREPVGRPSLF